MTITKESVLQALDGERWRVWSKVAEELTGRKATLDDVRLVRDIIRELESEGRIVRRETLPWRVDGLHYRSSRHDHIAREEPT